MPVAMPANHAQIALPVLLVRHIATAAAKAQVRVKVWAMKFIAIKIYQGEKHSSNKAILAVRRE
jgi:hypothetical protein